MSRFDKGQPTNGQQHDWPKDEAYSFSAEIVEKQVALDQCASRKVLRLNSYWRQLEDGNAIPRRTNIDPGRIRDLLANIMIIELHGNPLRVRYRLIGTAISAAMGTDVTGKWLDDVMEDADKRSRMLQLVEQVRDKRQPIYGHSSNRRDRRGCHQFHWAMFPLSDDSGDITQALIIEDYDHMTSTGPLRISNPSQPLPRKSHTTNRSAATQHD
jgi:hypothetical protein